MITFFFAGDFCSRSSTDSIVVTDELRELIQSRDYKVINFEVPLKPDNLILPPQERERFCQHDDSVIFLKSLGFNLFSLANNHAFDWGEEGFKKTKVAFGDASFGSGTYDEAYSVKVVEKDGIKIGFMALSFAAYTGVFDDVMNHEGLGCAYINDLRVNHDIIEAKKKVDFLFVLPHDGIEYIDIPMPETIARYRDFIDYGADGVVGTHPHCPQGWEEYKGKPIFYSLGNFLFNSKEGYDYVCEKPHWYEGLCVLMAITDGQLSWEVVNTRNVNNIGIEIDNESTREKHNLKICGYLSDKNQYDDYLTQICDSMGVRERGIIDRTFHLRTLKESTRQIVRLWIGNIRHRDYSDDNAIRRLLTHDTRRHLLLWTLKQKKTK